MTQFSFAIDADNGFIMMRFGDGPEHYFAAALDANASAEDILGRFRGFLGSENPLNAQ